MGGPRAKARRRRPTTQTDVSGVRHRLLNAAAVQSSPFGPGLLTAYAERKVNRGSG